VEEENRLTNLKTAVEKKGPDRSTETVSVCFITKDISGVEGRKAFTVSPLLATALNAMKAVIHSNFSGANLQQNVE